jgi:hypothetical protein
LLRYKYGCCPTSTKIAVYLGLGVHGNKVVHIVCIHDTEGDVNCRETVHVGGYVDDTNSIPVVGLVETAQDYAC